MDKPTVNKETLEKLAEDDAHILYMMRMLQDRLTLNAKIRCMVSGGNPDEVELSPSPQTSQPISSSPATTTTTTTTTTHLAPVSSHLNWRQTSPLV